MRQRTGRVGRAGAGRPRGGGASGWRMRGQHAAHRATHCSRTRQRVCLAGAAALTRLGDSWILRTFSPTPLTRPLAKSQPRTLPKGDPPSFPALIVGSRPEVEVALASPGGEVSASAWCSSPGLRAGWGRGEGRTRRDRCGREGGSRGQGCSGAQQLCGWAQGGPGLSFALGSGPPVLAPAWWRDWHDCPRPGVFGYRNPRVPTPAGPPLVHTQETLETNV